MHQWTYRYGNGSLGHVTSAREGVFLIVVYPPNAADGGNLAVEAALRFEDAVGLANTTAGERSQPSDWRANVEALRAFVDGLTAGRGGLEFMLPLQGDPVTDNCMAVQFPGPVFEGIVIREPSQAAWIVRYVRRTVAGHFGVVERVTT